MQTQGRQGIKRQVRSRKNAPIWGLQWRKKLASRPEQRRRTPGKLLPWWKNKQHKPEPKNSSIFFVLQLKNYQCFPHFFIYLNSTEVIFFSMCTSIFFRFFAFFWKSNTLQKHDYSIIGFNRYTKLYKRQTQKEMKMKKKNSGNYQREDGRLKVFKRGRSTWKFPLLTCFPRLRRGFQKRKKEVEVYTKIDESLKKCIDAQKPKQEVL